MTATDFPDTYRGRSFEDAYLNFDADNVDVSISGTHFNHEFILTPGELRAVFLALANYEPPPPPRNTIKRGTILVHTTTGDRFLVVQALDAARLSVLNLKDNFLYSTSESWWSDVATDPKIYRVESG